VSAPRRTLWVAVACLALAGLGWVLDPARFMGGWLAALALLAGWPLGSMALLLVHALTGGTWGEALRPALRLGVCALPVLLPLLLPYALGLPVLYVWARPGPHPGNPDYLNTGFFALRGVAYLAVWLGLAALVLRGRSLGRIAPVGLFLLALTVSFAAIDTTMSLDVPFASSIWGMVAGTGMVLLALAAAVLATSGPIPPGPRKVVARLLLALAILWTYLDFMQVLVVWQSNLPPEARWYTPRAEGVWGGVRVVLALGHSALPILLLLSPLWQVSPAMLRFVAGLLVAMAVLRSWWDVLPSLHQGIGWIALAGMAGAVGIAWTAARALQSRLHHA
jgi:hypothetical protein